MSPSDHPPRPAEKSVAESSPTAGSASPPTSSEVIPPAVREALEKRGVDPEKAEVKLTLSVARMFSGPIPPAEMLAEYDALQPGLGRELIGWARAQQEHRRGLEQLTTRGAEKRMNRSQTYSFILALLSIGGGIFAAWLGLHWIAAIIVVAGIGGPNAATVLARYLDRKTG